MRETIKLLKHYAFLYAFSSRIMRREMVEIKERNLQHVVVKDKNTLIIELFDKMITMQNGGIIDYGISFNNEVYYVGEYKDLSNPDIDKWLSERTKKMYKGENALGICINDKNFLPIYSDGQISRIISPERLCYMQDENDDEQSRNIAINDL